MWILGKAFIYFVAWKALSTLLFREPLNVLAVALMVIAVCAIEYFAFLWAGATYGRQAARATIYGGAPSSAPVFHFQSGMTRNTMIAQKMAEYTQVIAGLREPLVRATMDV